MRLSRICRSHSRSFRKSGESSSNLEAWLKRRILNSKLVKRKLMMRNRSNKRFCKLKESKNKPKRMWRTLKSLVLSIKFLRKCMILPDQKMKQKRSQSWKRLYKKNKHRLISLISWTKSFRMKRFNKEINLSKNCQRLGKKIVYS